MGRATWCCPGAPASWCHPGPTGPTGAPPTRSCARRCSALRDDRLRARFGAAARTSVLRRTWTTVGDELLVHYADVIAAADPARAA